MVTGGSKINPLFYYEHLNSKHPEKSVPNIPSELGKHYMTMKGKEYTVCLFQIFVEVQCPQEVNTLPNQSQPTTTLINHSRRHGFLIHMYMVMNIVPWLATTVTFKNTATCPRL